MAARAQDAAATGRVVTARFPYREVAAIVGVVFTATSALIVGMQWAISNNLGPLFLAVESLESQVEIVGRNVNVLHGEFGELRGEFGVLRGEFGELRGEVRGLRAEVAANRDQIAENRAEIAENRRQIVDLRERMAKVETGLDQVQANQVRMLDILERGPPPGE